MHLRKLSLAEVKEHKHELILTVGYTLTLAIVYMMWSYKAWNLIWVSVVIALLIIFIGCLFYYIWMLKLTSKKVEGEKEMNTKNEEVEENVH